MTLHFICKYLFRYILKFRCTCIYLYNETKVNFETDLAKKNPHGILLWSLMIKVYQTVFSTRTNTLISYSLRVVIISISVYSILIKVQRLNIRTVRVDG